MGDISEHFSRWEFECHDSCGLDTVDVELVNVLENIRRHIGYPILVTSGNRCAELNEAIGGAENSYHLVGKAADIVVDEVPAITLYQLINKLYPDSYGLGYYNYHVHLDVGRRKARWGL